MFSISKVSLFFLFFLLLYVFRFQKHNVVQYLWFCCSLLSAVTLHPINKLLKRSLMIRWEVTFRWKGHGKKPICDAWTKLRWIKQAPDYQGCHHGFLSQFQNDVLFILVCFLSQYEYSRRQKINLSFWPLPSFFSHAKIIYINTFIQLYKILNIFFKIIFI